MANDTCEVIIGFDGEHVACGQYAVTVINGSVAMCAEHARALVPECTCGRAPREYCEVISHRI